MDELLVPEITLDVDNPPTELTETNEDSVTPELPTEEPQVSPVNEASEVQQNEVSEVQQQEEQHEKVLAGSPETTNESVAIPHSEQNGDIVNLDDDSNQNEKEAEVEIVNQGQENEKEAEVEIVNQSQENEKEAEVEIVNQSQENEKEAEVEIVNHDQEIVNHDKVPCEENASPLECTEISAISEPEKEASIVINEESSLSTVIPDKSGEVVSIENAVPFDPLDIRDDEFVQPKKKSKHRYLQPDQIPKDYTAEELEVYNKLFGQGNQSIQFTRIHCTACNIHLGSAPNKQYKRFIHPLLRVQICQACYEFYGSGEFDKDEDGSELYCRWCGQGGKVLCCAKCPFVFCQKCIKCNLGKGKLQEVLDSEDWLCFECVPSQTIKLRVAVRALYDFVQSEINLAAELNQPERLKVDSSMCCNFKQKGTTKIKIKLPGIKRKNDDTIKNDALPKKKKMKLKMLSTLLTTPIENNLPLNHGHSFINPVAISSRAWDPQDEDEVVCTPDLSLLMPLDNDDDTATAATQIPGSSPQCSQPLPPPPHLLPVTNSFPKSKKGSNLRFMEPIQPPNMFTAIRPPPNALGYILPKKSLVLNTSTTRPLLSSSKVLNKVPKMNIMPIGFTGIPQLPINITQNRNTVKVPSKIIPGTKYDWFEKASQFTSRVNTNLSTRLTSLAKEQSTVSSLEGLASVHNNFQEILNNSIKSLTQIRKNLRNDFINGLKTLKQDSSDTIPNITPLKTTQDDGDVIIVDAPSPLPKPAATSTPVTFGRLKLKPVSSLIIDTAVITIPDDVFNEPIVRRVVPTEKPKETQEVTEAAVPVVEVKETTPPPVPETSPPEVIEDDLNPETRALIKRALQESKFETLMNDNMKVNVPSEITKDLLKRMVSVRVMIENSFGPATPRMRPRPGYTPMNIHKEDEDDIENLLSSSIVLNISKRKVFNNDNIDGGSEPILTINDEVTHLSNGIL